MKVARKGVGIVVGIFGKRDPGKPGFRDFGNGTARHPAKATAR